MRLRGKLNILFGLLTSLKPLVDWSLPGHISDDSFLFALYFDNATLGQTSVNGLTHKALFLATHLWHHERGHWTVIKPIVGFLSIDSWALLIDWVRQKVVAVPQLFELLRFRFAFTFDRGTPSWGVWLRNWSRTTSSLWWHNAYVSKVLFTLWPGALSRGVSLRLVEIGHQRNVWLSSPLVHRTGSICELHWRISKWAWLNLDWMDVLKAVALDLAITSHRFSGRVVAL